ncbi:hypothetical protein IKT18_00850 [Candidatus Saccharibacteria bacterium]|nr:hypothetical protein [Candidatus Saccharibacteria bacterium]
MKYKKAKTALAASIIAATSVMATPVFATNPYDITYTDGQELGEETVTINPTLLAELTPLIDMGADDVEIAFSNSNLWKEGYSNNNFCTPIKYVEVSGDADLSEVENLYYTVSNRQYTIRVDIASIIKEDLAFTTEAAWVAAGVLTGNSATPKGTPKGSLEVGFQVATDETCETNATGSFNIASTRGTIFLDTKQKLFATSAPNKVFSSSELYYGILDIDANQAFKILNTGNELTKSNMFAKSAAALQPATGEARNMYSEEGKYIYAQGTVMNQDSDVFVKLSEATQTAGLEMVYGIRSNAGSPISYYAKQYAVKYVSDENGEIKDIETENIIAGKTPSGSTTTPADGYELDYWTADKDVTLTDGTTIKAGNPISSEELAEVIVNEDLVFTAVHVESEPLEVPDTGASTSEKNAALVAISVIGAVLGASILGVLAKAIRKIHRRSQF